MLTNEVCKDVSVEPLLTPFTGENIESRSAKTGDEARLDISAIDFWVKGQKAFFDGSKRFKVCYPKSPTMLCQKREREKKWLR